MKSIHQDVFAGIALLIVTSIFFYMTTVLPDRAALFPEFILSILCFFSIAIMINGFLKSKRAKQGVAVNQGDEEEKLTFSIVKRPLLFLFILTIYIACLDFFGFFMTTSFLIVIILYLLDCRKPLTYMLTILGTNIFIYILFVTLLQVNLPQGILF